MSRVEDVDLRVRKAFPWQREKVRQILRALNTDPVDITAVRQHAISLGGLVDSHVRKKAWPKLAGVNVFDIPLYLGPPLSSHKDRAQVLLDVNRCGRRIPANYSESRRSEVKEQLSRVILRLLAENKALHYYQGLHDIVITFLLVVGEDTTYAIMNTLVNFHIRDFLDVDMSRTKLVIGYLRPLLALEDAELEHFVTSSECEYYFSLSWLITWFGHVVQHPEEAFRLADVFLATHPLMPLYMAAVIVLSQRSAVLQLECEMSAVHGLLSKLPPGLSYEDMIAMACELFERHPPKELAKRGGFKLSTISLISTYPKFQRLTRSQHPNHVLATLPKQKRTTSWWPSLSANFFLRLLSIAGPVMLAIVFYWIQHYLRTSELRITFTS